MIFSAILESFSEEKCRTGGNSAPYNYINFQIFNSDKYYISNAEAALSSGKTTDAWC